MAEVDLKDLERRMHGASENLKHEFAGLRTGRASAALLDPINVEVYGSKMPLNQVGTVTVPEARMLAVQVWDQGNVQSVEKAIRNAGLGLNPMLDGATVRIPIPELTAERRQELSKVAAKYAEQSRIAIRNVRRDGMESIKKAEKDGMGKDEAKSIADNVQKLTDSAVKVVDEMLSTKEQEITQV